MPGTKLRRQFSLTRTGLVRLGPLSPFRRFPFTPLGEDRPALPVLHSARQRLSFR
jgi:hypothetical protein